ncbi:hypothetical protein Bca52824_010487 [Brassica carinata]|uniref:Uncharacterized protein n=1 Tax=Brassica carinata TaxID=52824 RepID=A0A8X8B7Q6_BRACI|nr:hypothetical protein Bca52824_010487 [Brassica carinata]
MPCLDEPEGQGPAVEGGEGDVVPSSDEGEEVVDNEGVESELCRSRSETSFAGFCRRRKTEEMMTTNTKVAGCNDKNASSLQLFSQIPRRRRRLMAGCNDEGQGRTRRRRPWKNMTKVVVWPVRIGR